MKIFKEDMNLVSFLVQLGLDAKLIKNGIIVSGDTELLFNTSKNIKENFAFFIDCEEAGGGFTNTGEATIICGINGEALKPYHVPSRGHLACETHAKFSVKNSVIEVKASHHRRDFSVSISRYEIETDPRLQLKNTKIWTGRPEELPVSFSKFSQAVKAACEKAVDYHCRTPYFIITK